MATSSPNARAAALGPIALLLGPVGLLACLGIWSLRQDRLLVVQEAREQARFLAAGLAQRFQTQCEQGVNLYLDESSSATAAPLSEPPKFEAAQPAGQPQPVCRVRDGKLISPPDYPDIAGPPRWLPRISAADLQDWSDAAQSVQRGEIEQARARWETLAQHSDPELAANARWELLRHGMATNANRTAACLTLCTDFPETLTVSGMPLGDVALWEALRQDAPVATHMALRQAIARRVTDYPSSFTADLLQALALRAQREPALRPTWQQLQTRHAAAEQARRFIGALLEQGPLHPGVRPCGAEPDAPWALIATAAAPTHQPAADYTVLLLPPTLLTEAREAARRLVASAWPPYLHARLLLEGVPLPELGARDSVGEELAMQTGTLTLHAQPFAFSVRVLLADRAQLLVRQRQRTQLFGALVVAAAAVAGVGAWWMHRNWRRQLLLNEAKSNFVSSVSHELRAPIASVRLMAEGLEQGRIQEPARQRHYFQLIGQECRRLSALIENVLDVARIEQGRKQYELEPIDLPALFRSTVQLMEPPAAEYGCRLELRMPDLVADAAGQEPFACVGDGRALQQALVNLIDNALKHSPRGGVVRVGLLTQRAPARGGQSATHSPADLPTAGWLQLYVEDDGEGIPPEDHQRIFARFYRRGSELRRETQGVGIGLSIVQHVAAAHGGRVLVRSAVGQGSRFTLELPWRES